MKTVSRWKLQHSLKNAISVRRRSAQRSAVEVHRHAQREASVCFIGFGEAGQAVAAGLHDEGVETIVAWDILFPVDEGPAILNAISAAARDRN